MASSNTRIVPNESLRPCGLTDAQINEIDFLSYMIKSNVNYAMQALLENLIGETITISIRTLVVVNSYNCITGTVKEVITNAVLLENCHGYDNYGNYLENDKQFVISSFNLYHPAMLAFLKLTHEVEKYD